MKCSTEKCEAPAQVQFDGRVFCPTCHAKAHAQWFTAEKIVKRFCDWTHVTDGMILEPSAGSGTLIDGLLEVADEVVGIEYDPRWAGELQERYADDPRVTIDCMDFLKVPQQNGFDAVVMNPPYENSADMLHVAHAMGFADHVYVLARTQFLFGKARKEKVWSQGFGLRQLGIFPQRPSYLLAGEKTGSPRHDYITAHLERGWGGDTEVSWL